MGLESATYINDLNTSNPVAGDNVSQGDDHLRLLKAVIKTTFPSLSAPRYLEQARSDLASATTPDLSTPTTNYINITGTTQIDGFATEPAGFSRVLRFNASLTLNYNGTSFILPTGDDIVTAAGDHAIAISMGSGNWVIAGYWRASGRALASFIPTPASGDIGKQLQATSAAVDGWGWQDAVPVGLIAPWPLQAVPNGSWVLCEGQAISRTTYADLFAILSTDYGSGNGTTTFNVPDYRGRFLRGRANGSANDPDRASRTDRGDGTTGDVVGTKQADQLELHGHPWRAGIDGADVDEFGGLALNDSGISNQAAYTGSLNDTLGHQIGGTGGNETRPINIYVNWIIKAKRNPA